MNNDTIKNDRLSYLIFFGIGCLSFHIYMDLEEMFSSNYNLKGNLGILVIYFLPFLIFSLLFALGIYTFKTRNFVFTLKTFIFSLIFSPLITIFVLFSFFEIGSLFLFFLGIPLIFIILFVIGSKYLNEKPLIRFTVKVFIFSFIGFFLSVAFTVFMFWASH